MDGVELGNARVLAPGRLRWLRTIGWMILLFFAIGFGFVLAGNLAARAGVMLTGGVFTTTKDAPELVKLASVIFGVLAGLGIYRTAVRYGENRRPAELSLPHLPLELLAGLAIGFALMAATIGVLWAGGWAVVTPQAITRVIPAIRDTIQSSVVEETIFRLVVLRLTWRAFGAWWALAFSALLFGALHLANPNASIFAAICIALEAGILLATFYILTGRAWAPIGVHAGWNFTQGWIFGAAVSGGSGFAGGPLLTVPAPGVPELLTGGSFGPEASLPGLVICTAAGLGLVRLAWRRGRMTPAD